MSVRRNKSAMANGQLNATLGLVSLRTTPIVNEVTSCYTAIVESVTI